jgi:2-polyprenyl-6-methoxyphenol hydroxylase-like FAD-dependent oxidoreductase
VRVVVLGDGPAGASAAAAATRQGLDAVLLGHGRVAAPGTLEVLDARATSALLALGWYDAVVSRAMPCHAVVVRWDADDYVERTSLLAPGGLGWVVDRAWFDPLVRARAAADGVRRLDAADAPVTVLATGKHAPGERRALGPDLVTLTAALPAAAAPGLRGRLVVESVDDGWWSAVADEETCAVSFTLPRASAPRGTSALRALWQGAVGRGPAWLPRDAGRLVPRARPVRSQLSVSTDGPLRVGDAALSVDPLSGHGLTLALEGGLRCLAHGYEEWLVQQADEHAAAGEALYTEGLFDPLVWALPA